MTSAWDIAQVVGTAIVLPILGYWLKQHVENTQDIKQIKTTLYGAEGQNGLSREVRSLRDKCHQHSNLLTDHNSRLDDLERHQ